MVEAVNPADWGAIPATAAGSPADWGAVPAEGTAMPSSKMSALGDVGRSAVTGVANKGVAALIGLPGAVQDLWRAGGDYATEFIAKQLGFGPEWVAEVKAAVEKGRKGVPTTLPRASDVHGVIKKGAESVGAEGWLAHEPQTRLGRYTETVAENVPAMFGGPGSVVGKFVKNALIPGVASEKAGEIVQDAGAGGTWKEGVARAGAAVATGGVANLVHRPTTAAKTIRTAVGDVDQATIDAAEALFQRAHAAGQPITRAEALQAVTGGGTNMGNVQRVVEGAGELKPFMAARAGQNDAAMRQTLDDMAPPSREPSNLGPQAGRAAAAEVRDVRQSINQAAEPHYTAAQQVRLNPQEMARVRALPGYPEARDAVLNNPQLARYVAGLPEDSVGFLNEVKKQLDQRSANAARPTDPNQNMQVSAGYGRDATAVRDTLVRSSREYETALALEAFGREQVLRPLLKTPIGQLAKRDIDTQRAINALFPANPLPNSAEEIGRAVSVLARRTPMVARQLVAAHVERTFNEATQNLMGGPNSFGGAKFAAAIRGNPQQAANLEAAVRALPNGDQVWTGLNRFLEHVEAQGMRQPIGSQTAFNAEMLADLRRGTPLQEAGSAVVTGGIKLPTRIMDALQRWRLGQGVGEIARLITDPRANDMFRTIALMPQGSNEAWILVGRLVGRGIIASQEPARNKE
jgi:hypothetical protein